MIISYLIVKPLLIAVISGMILGMIFYPVYSKINSKLRFKNLSAGIVTVLAILMILIPIIFLLQHIGTQTRLVYVLTKQKALSGDILGDDFCQNNAGLACKINDYYRELSENPKFIYERDRALDLLEKYF